MDVYLDIFDVLTVNPDKEIYTYVVKGTAIYSIYRYPATVDFSKSGLDPIKFLHTTMNLNLCNSKYDAVCSDGTLKYTFYLGAGPCNCRKIYK